MLGEFLEKNCPDVSVRTIVKHQSEWKPFVDSVSITVFDVTVVFQVCRSYGFYQRTCPFVYTIEGTLIGDGAAFVEHVRERYQKILAMTKDTQKKRTAENMHEIQEMMRKKKEGLTLGETIEKQIEKVKGKEAITHVGDTFF
jgi:hypothetical protein